MHPSGKPVILAPVWPNAGVQMWYLAQLDQLIAEMNHSARCDLIPAARDTPVIIATDAQPATAAGILFKRTFMGETRYLLVERANGTGWGIPGGKIERGEAPDEAARRETREELAFRWRGPLAFRTLHRFRDTLYVTFEAEVYEKFEPTLEREHKAYRWVTLAEALLLDLHPGLRLTLTGVSDSPEFASDASPTKELQRALQRWGDKWVKRFDLMSKGIAADFAAKNQRATQIGMQASLKKAGFAVSFKPTRASIEAYKAVAAENVALIKSIAQKYHTDVQAQVWESVKRGGDLKTVSEKLEKTYGVTRRRAALIARDQNAKAKATIEAVRHQELGIKQAIWMHSRAGKVPRPCHVKMNNKLYDLAVGMFDKEENEYVHPGQLINCRCTMRPYIPGFETVAYPEWEVAQT
jgi:SPP1 gp7 family putative phage head morphogenesis protein